MKALRLKTSLTAVQVAAELGVSPSTVSNWDQGRTCPTLNPVQMLKLSQLYSCSLEDLAQACQEILDDQPE